MDDKRYYTIYNNHVLSGAKVIGYVGIGLSGFGCCMSMVTLNLTNLLFGLMTLMVYACVVVACRRHDPSLYLPFLIINSVTIAFNVVYIGFLCLMIATMPKYWERELAREGTFHGKNLNHDSSSEESSFETDPQDLQHAARITTGVILALMIIVECLTIWFQSIVYRAYRYMKADNTNLIPPDVFVK